MHTANHFSRPVPRYCKNINQRQLNAVDVGISELTNACIKEFKYGGSRYSHLVTNIENGMEMERFYWLFVYTQNLMV